jgi:hypothetical protein
VEPASRRSAFVLVFPSGALLPDARPGRTSRGEVLEWLNRADC